MLALRAYELMVIIDAELDDEVIDATSSASPVCSTSAAPP